MGLGVAVYLIGFQLDYPKGPVVVLLGIIIFLISLYRSPVWRIHE